MTFFDKLPETLRPDRSLVARLVGSFLTVSILTLGSVALVTFIEARASLRDAIADRLTTAAARKEGELIRWVEQQRNMLEFLTEIPTLGEDAERLMATPSAPAARQRIELLFGRAISARSDLEELSLLSPVGGEVIATTNPDRLGSYRVNELFYSRGKSDTFVQNVYTSPATGRTALTIASPVTDETGRTIAVLAGELDLAYLDRPHGGSTRARK